jgi:glycosyltransferase involved in cell wall biosynthesis
MPTHVSIVVLNFNYARFLPRSIDHALAQDYPDTEVIVVDDASQDESAEIIRRYKDAVVPVLRETNGGQGAAMNDGFKASRGELIIFVDADDYLYPSAVSRVVEAWSEGVAMVQYRLDLIDPTGRIVDVYPPHEVSFDSGDVVPNLLSAGRFENTVTSGNAFSRAALQTILPVPEEDFRLSADGYLVTVVPFAGPVVSIEQPLGAY